MKELSNVLPASGWAASIRMCSLSKTRFVDSMCLILRARGVSRRDLCNDIAQF